MAKPTITVKWNAGNKASRTSSVWTSAKGVRVADKFWIEDLKPEKHIVIVGVEL